MLTQDQSLAIIHMRHAAQTVSDRALVAYYTERVFHIDDLAQQVERLQERIDAYREAMGKGV